MLLEDIRIAFMEPCIAEPEKIRLKAELSNDITEAMPYLNSVIGNAIYNKIGPFLAFTKEDRLVALYPTTLTMAKASNMTDALQVLDWFKVLVNDTWDNRIAIIPNHEKKQRPTAMMIFTLLPKTNCRVCGEANCYAFAAKIIQGTQNIKNCSPLSTSEYIDQKTSIEAWIGVG